MTNLDRVREIAMDPDICHGDDFYRSVLALVAVAKAAAAVSAVSGLRAEYMQEELSDLNEALASLAQDGQPKETGK